MKCPVCGHAELVPDTPAIKPSEALNLHREAIRRIVEANNTLNPRVFGSVMRGEDDEDSDLDLLVDATNKTSLFDLGGIIDELQTLLGVRVDLVTTGGLPAKWRDEVLATAIPV